MKLIEAVLVPAVSFTMAAAPFQNLSFDEANTNALAFSEGLLRGYFGPVSGLVPGWSLSLGTNALDEIWFNVAPHLVSEIGGGAILRTHEGRSATTGGNDFGFEYISPGGIIFEPLTLSQRGDIPEDARFLSFDRTAAMVSIDGITLYQPRGWNYRLPGTEYINIEQYAGRNVELQISSTILDSGTFVIDDIRIIPVPEPTTVTLLGLGGLLVGLRLVRASVSPHY